MSTTSTLVNLSRRLDQKLAASGVVNFARNQDDESTLSKVGKGAAIGAGAAGAVAGGLYLRGRHALGKGTGIGVKDTLKYGGNLIARNDFPQIGRGADSLAKSANKGAKVVGAKTAAAKSAISSGIQKIKARVSK